MFEKILPQEDSPEHAIHGFQVLVVQEPHIPILVVLIKGNGEAISNVQDALARPGAQQESDHSLLVSNFTHPSIFSIAKTETQPELFQAYLLK